MRKIRTISSPRLDYTLAPSEWRRYSNQIFCWNILLFILFFMFWQYSIFYNEHFFTILNAVVRKDEIYLQDVKILTFYIKILMCIGLATYPALKFTALITKAIQRIEVLKGNFVDDTEEVFSNISRDFGTRNINKGMRLINAGDTDIAQSRAPYTKLATIPHDIFLPSSILELSWIVRGEAGSGKTVFTDRVLKETINAGHKVVLHNLKGDEFNKLNGFCSFYLIEPWNEKAGYAINFLSLVARNKEEDRNAYIYSLVKSFCKADKNNAFFSDASIEVLYAIIKKVVEDEMKKPKFQATLKSVVDLWVSFNAKTEEAEIDLTNIEQMRKVANNKIQSLEKIKAVLLEKNPTQADLIDSENAKTSLCILATCTKTLKKFEVLAKFWGNRELEKSFNIEKWLNNPKDRQVLMLTNSNIYVAEAEAYISAVVNLVTMFVINNEYKPSSELHFILDEFVQLSSIDLKQFMKLPDVGRGKLVRTKVVMQRTSQIKEVFDMDGNSFSGAFQNKIWARMATDDFTNINAELGKQLVRIHKSSANNNKDGMSSTNSTEEKLEDVVNPANLQKELGPLFYGDKFLGVNILMNFSQVKRIPIAYFPPVSFEKKVKTVKAKPAISTQAIAQPSASTTADTTAKPPTHHPIQSVAIETVVEVAPLTATEPDQAHDQAETDPMGSAMLDIAGHLATAEPVSMALQAVELMEAFETPNNNKNIVAENSTATTSNFSDEQKLAIKKIMENNKKKKELDL